MSHLDKSQYTQRVKALIIDHLPSGDIQLENIRRDLASRHIQENAHSLTEISFLLGFSDESAFSRAFKRWTGKLPSDYSHRL